MQNGKMMASFPRTWLPRGPSTQRQAMSTGQSTACAVSKSAVGISRLGTDTWLALRSGINKPVAVLSWYMATQPTEDYIVIVDADMIMLKAFDPVQMGVKPGDTHTHAHLM